MTAPPAVVSVGWRYTFCDLLTDTPLAVLPLRDADLTEVIGGAGSGSGTVSLASARVRSLDPWAATTPRRTICYAQRLVTRNGVLTITAPLWHGIVWARDRTKASMSLTMATPESYYDHRLVARDRLLNADDAFIMRTLFQDAEAVPSGSLQLRYTDELAGVVSERTLATSDLKTVLSVAKSIATAGDGLDWRIIPGLDSAGRFTKTLTISPRLGRVGLAELTWQSKGAGRASNEVLGYTMTEDGTAVANLMVGLGDGQGTSQLRSVVRASDIGNTELADGYPLLESSLNSSTSDLKTQSVLDRHTRGALAGGLATELQITGVTVSGTRAPAVDRYALGDEIRLRLNDPALRAPATIASRLVARRIQPGQPGRTEKVAMTLTDSRVVVS